MRRISITESECPECRHPISLDYAGRCTMDVEDIAARRNGEVCGHRCRPLVEDDCTCPRGVLLQGCPVHHNDAKPLVATSPIATPQQVARELVVIRKRLETYRAYFPSDGDLIGPALHQAIKDCWYLLTALEARDAEWHNAVIPNPCSSLDPVRIMEMHDAEIAKSAREDERERISVAVGALQEYLIPFGEFQTGYRKADVLAAIATEPEQG